MKSIFVALLCVILVGCSSSLNTTPRACKTPAIAQVPKMRPWHRCTRGQLRSPAFRKKCTNRLSVIPRRTPPAQLECR